MKSTSWMMGALCAVHLALGGALGYGWRQHTQRAPRPVSTTAILVAPVATPPNAVSRSESPPALAPLVLGASPWSEPAWRAPTRPPARQGTVRAPETDDPLPDRVAPTVRCTVRNEARFLGRTPHVPLVSVRRGEVQSVAHECYAQWSMRGARWRALDAWGQVVGVAETVGGEGYAISRAYELALALRSGREGTGLYVDEESPWEPSPSAEWTPTAQAREGYQRLLAQSDELFSASAETVPSGLRPARTTMFFSVRDSTGERRYFAASGGRAFTIAALASDGVRWRFVHMTRASNSAPPNAFELVAVVDFVGDGTPEVIVHNDEHDGFWDDQVFVSDDLGNIWGAQVRSSGGGTI